MEQTTPPQNQKPLEAKAKIEKWHWSKLIVFCLKGHNQHSKENIWIPQIRQGTDILNMKSTQRTPKKNILKIRNEWL